MIVKFFYTLCGHTVVWDRPEVPEDIRGECPLDSTGTIRINLECFYCEKEKIKEKNYDKTYL